MDMWVWRKREADPCITGLSLLPVQHHGQRSAALSLCFAPAAALKPNPVWLHVTNKPPLFVTHFHAENHVIQFPICKNPLYLSSWIISILILIHTQHWLLHPPSRSPVSLPVSGSDVTPNYNDSSPSNITMSLWCSCRGTGNQEPECDAFHRDFTHNTCLSESSVCLIPRCLWWPNLVTKPWRLKKRR